MSTGSALWDMPASLFTKPSSSLPTHGQLPQHPKMRLSYILNPSTPPTRTPEPISVPEESVSHFPSSPCSSDFGDAITTLFILDLEESDLLYNPSQTSSVHEFPHESQPRSRSCSPSLWASKDLMSPPNSFVPDLSFDSLGYSLSDNSRNDPQAIMIPEMPYLGTPSPMNRGATELPNLPDRSAIHPAHLRLPPLQPRDLNILPNNSLPHPELHSTDAKPSSSTVIHQPVPHHSTMPLSNHSSSLLKEHAETTPELVEPSTVLAPTSRSPSLTLSDSLISSSSTSLFHFNGSPDLTRHPRSDSPRHNEFQIPSPATTPPSSPPPVPHPIPDLPQIVQPPQLLPWEGPPPPGLNPRNHRAYQRAGVHWMLGQIFGSDIG